MRPVAIAVIMAFLSYKLVTNQNTTTTNTNPSLPQVKVINVVQQLTRHPTKRYSFRSTGAIDKIIMHHSATDSGSAEAFANFHVNTKGWPGIGYHFVIEKNGTIKQTNRMDVVSYQVSGQNSTSIGICCTGHYDRQIMPIAQLTSAIWLVNKIRRDLGFLPVNYHNQYSEKTCPGTNFPYTDFERRIVTTA